MAQEEGTVYCVVYLEEAHCHVVILKTWINDYNNVKTLNNGVNTNQRHLVYFSTNFDSTPDFDHVRISSVFDETTQQGYYYARTKRYFGKLFFII